MTLAPLARVELLAALASDRRPSTPRQREVVLAIVEHSVSRGQCPTVGELAVRVGVTQGPLHECLVRLRRNGWVTWEAGMHRTLRVMGFVSLAGAA